MIYKNISAASKVNDRLLSRVLFLVFLFLFSFFPALVSISFANQQNASQADDSEALRTYLRQYYQSNTQSLPDIPILKKWQQKKQKDIRQQYAAILSKTPKIAIIIDDIGNNKDLDLRAINLPGAITLSILPHTPHGKTLAQIAFEKQKEIMLHAPMESIEDNNLGEGGLTDKMSETEFKNMLERDINSIPHIVGLNNHMGSLLTQNKKAMSWLMASLKENNLYFVDSRTIATSVAADLALKYKINHISRDVFLDHEANTQYTEQAFQKALRISKKTGTSLVIGHPYPSTLDYLENNMHQLQEQGIELVSVSELIRFQNSVQQKSFPEK